MCRHLATLIALLCLATPLAAQGPERHVPYKDPAAATLISFLITGGGQIYTGEVGKGAAMLGISIAAPVEGAVGTVLSCGDLDDPDYGGEDCNLTPFLVGLGVSLATKVWSMVDAPGSARRMNERNGATRTALPLQLRPTIGSARDGATEVGITIVRVR